MFLFKDTVANNEYQGAGLYIRSGPAARRVFKKSEKGQADGGAESLFAGIVCLEDA